MTTRCINSRSLSLSLTMYFLARTDSPGIGYRTVSRQQTDNCRNSCMNSLPAQAPLRCGVSYGPVSVCPSVWPPVQVGFLSKFRVRAAVIVFGVDAPTKPPHTVFYADSDTVSPKTKKYFPPELCPKIRTFCIFQHCWHVA